MTKPTQEEVLKYAEPKIKYAISKRAYQLPLEQQEEIMQEAFVRVLEAHSRLDGDTWKSFVATHAVGAVIDYIKMGKGNLEDRKGKETRKNITSRLVICDEEDSSSDVDTIAGIYGIFLEADFMSAYKIKWDLVAQMASIDTSIHMLAKIILGFDLDELAKIFRCSPEHISRRYRRFLKRLDTPAYARDPWIDQFIYAFGLCENFDMPNVSNGLAEDLIPVDLYSAERLQRKVEMDGPAYSWIQDIIPDGVTLKTLKVNWHLLAQMAGIDDNILLVALILKGRSQLWLSKYFSEDVAELKSRCLRFVKRFDSSADYHNAWIRQTIFALGISDLYAEEKKDWGVGNFLRPVDLDGKKRSAKHTYQTSLLFHAAIA